MEQQEQQLITGLATRLQQAAASIQKDPQADNLIQSTIATQGNAIYLLVQMALLQEMALQNAQQEIARLQTQLQSNQNNTATRQSSFLGRVSEKLFGGSATRTMPNQQVQPPIYGQQTGAPYAQSARFDQAGMGPANYSRAPGFLQSAAATAVGVAGGAFLFEGISNLFSGSHANTLGSFAQTIPAPSETIVNNYYEGTSAPDADNNIQSTSYDNANFANDSNNNNFVDDNNYTGSADFNDDNDNSDDSFFDGGFDDNNY